MSGKNFPNMSRREQLMSRDCPTRFEKLDLTPVVIPEDAEHPESMEQMMRRLIREHVSASAKASGLGTFEEENDLSFEEDEPDITTPYTQLFDMQEQYPVEQGENPPTVPDQGHDQPPAEPDVGAEEPPVEASGTPNTPPE